MWWLEGVLELFDKYLEKCLWPHIFELCFSLTYGKKNCPNRCLKICSTANIVLHILPSGLVSSYMTLRKEECQQNTFSQVGNETTISLNFWLVLGDRRKRTHIVGKEVIRRVSKQIGEDRVYKTAKFWGYVLYAWTFIKYILKSFEVLYTLYNDSKKILWTKYLLLIASFEQFNHKKCS